MWRQQDEHEFSKKIYVNYKIMDGKMRGSQKKQSRCFYSVKYADLWQTEKEKLLKGWKMKREKRSGSRAQSIPQMKSKWQLVRHKHACHPWELAGRWWLIRLLLSNGRGGKQDGNESNRHLYFIGLDAVMPLKLMLQLPRGKREWTQQSQQRKKNNGRWRERRDLKRKEWNMTEKEKKEERWKGAWQVNLEQISIVTEQESRMWWVVTGSG